MLHAAAAADAKVGQAGVTWSPEASGCALSALARSSASYGSLNIQLLERQRAFDENGLAFEAGNSASFVVERFDDSDRHLCYPKKSRFREKSVFVKLARRRDSNSLPLGS